MREKDQGKNVPSNCRTETGEDHTSRKTQAEYHSLRKGSPTPQNRNKTPRLFLGHDDFYTSAGRIEYST